MDAAPSKPSHSATTHRPGQACDRCRKKKIKCDGAFPTCRNCVKSGHICEVSATLRRNTKVRGFTSDEQQLVQLQEELAKYKELLQSEKEKNAQLKEELFSSEHARSRPETDSLATRLPEPAASRQTGKRQSDDPTYMIKHMGRLVHDEIGVGRFAGSTTGIHFVLSVEQQCQKVLNLPSSFPESCFRLFLAQTSSANINWTTENFQIDHSEISTLFNHSSSFYCDQVDLFISEWEAFCPVLVRKQLMTDVKLAIERVHDPRNPQAIDHATLLTLLVILIINGLGHSTSAQNSNTERFIIMANALTNKSLGLHRHSRRFKMKPCEVELRKRLWWWVYNFDVITSLLHGLPSLIHDVDVDNDMPLDCHINDLDAADISHPLPGERTAVFIFIQYVNLGKILSRVREMLYTTTQRRNGAVKIHDLNLNLRMWNQNLKMNGIDFDIGNVSSRDTSGEPASENERTTLWLQLLANVAMVLVHRPGLSFDDTTVDFSNCVGSCLASGTAILSLLHDPQAPQWLRNMSLVGPSMVFQSSLMHIYGQCYSRSVHLEGCPSLETSIDCLQNGISILQRDGANSSHFGSSFYHESITETIKTLQLLHTLLAQDGQNTPGAGPSIYDEILGQPPGILDDQVWSANALDALNYVIPTDWMYEVPGPFMGCMDLDGP
ncbi:hypothetical protein N7456_008703 [Penicillium angulare]|uniref:Zn(2)-C6 fungal-type domain-containing protein n=1 Tax=Penicillium angulare TaxID=116970 RepID=A0A9W9F3K7_9EURO|nr:hypothetical protein N7456_008703 [Penicillium angulare]